MSLKIATRLLVLHLTINLVNSQVYSFVRPKIITYGEPCIKPHKLPIRIEGPKPPVEEPKIPISMNFRVVSEALPPPRTEYPIAIEVPEVPVTELELSETVVDSLRGKTYGYNIDVPPVRYTLPSRSYNFGVEVPPPKIQTYSEQVVEKPVRYLTGLRSRVDRVLVPACEVQWD